MRFLCLHGQGTNSEILEAQTGVLRYELGDEHEFDFIEGTVPSDPAPEIATLARPGDHFFSWLDTNDERCAEITRQGLEDLDAYIAEEGPFDGVLAFSQGAAVASTYLLHKAKQDPTRQHIDPVFKCAVFISGLLPGDLTALEQGEWRQVDPEASGSLINIPTANIWGTKDPTPGCGSALSSICEKSLRETAVHGGGHEVPGVKDKAAVQAMVTAIRRTVQRALSRQ